MQAAFPFVVVATSSPTASTPPGDATIRPPGMQLVGPIATRHRLGELSLVLASMEIAHAVRHQDNGFYLLVADEDAPRTVYALHAFLAENRDWPPRPTRERLPFPPSRLAPIVMAVIAIVFWITGPVALHSPWFAVGTAESRRILHGEVWRALTALTLHADAMHLLGNVLAGSIFLAVVFRRLGPGRGVFFTLLAGAFGNLANAALHGVLRTPHASIGASTAVFSALGILASTQLAVNRASGARRWTDRVGPIFGGLALLGMLGSSPHSDLWAHFFGLLAGGAMGWLAVRSAVTPERARRTQVHFGAAAAAMVIGAWLAAWMFARAHGVVAT